ncbi:MAG TPA: N-acetylmuramoyl-L-alanine amidase, partial [Thermoanaerobaculia bacterium]|nr:N-acetylmuramoyl-L-alanine amidase [Thermoanaerobaculia bacterium]
MRRTRPRLAAFLPLVALLAVALASQAQRPSAPPPDAASDSVEIAVPTVVADGATLAALAPVARRLGGTLEEHPGGSWSLAFGEERVLFGPDSSALAVGTEVLPLSRAPQVVGGAIYVPADFFERVYARFGGWTTSLDAGRLTASRRDGRTLAVSTDAVHLQGVTTVVLQFPARPRFEIEERGASVVVELAGGDRVESLRPRPVDDPLVEAIEIAGERIVLRLAPGAAVESYTLESPFRLVFDVHRGAGVAAGEPEPPALEPPEPPTGIRVIVLDPGHGGSETGAIGPSGVAEKDLTLALARTLAARLEAALPVRVVLTRDEDANLPHETRTAIANQNKADLFLSLHLNSAFGPTAHGAETYFLSTAASDERAARSAAEENRPGGAAPAAGAAAGDDPLYDLQLMLWDLAQNHFLSESQRLAKLIQGELNSTLGLRDRGVKQAPFLVLMGAAMPAVLVEVGFLSNPDEERRLQDAAYRAELADAL